MKKIIITALNQLNQSFYQIVASDFSQSRNYPWPGWQKLLPFLRQKKSLTVLDLGCGNGRFAQFLSREFQGKLDYLGIDSSHQLLEVAKESLKEKPGRFSWQITDLVKNHLEKNGTDWPKNKKFDLIVAFGLSHHLPSMDLRSKFLRNLKKLLKANGLLVISNWQFAEEKERFTKNILTAEKIKKNENLNIWQKFKLNYLLKNLEKNDYLLDWNMNPHGKTVFRYCHYLSEEEMQDLSTLASLKMRMQFFADGKSGRLNQYFVLTKENSQQ